MIRPWLALAAAAILACSGATAGSRDAVVLVYHHVAADTPSSTSVAPQQFRRQLEHLAAGGFRVLALEEILNRLDSGRELPPDTVALTFDDGYESVYTTAFPMLRERGWPFTVFVTTDYVGGRGYLDWSQLQQMAAVGADIGNHTRSHPYWVRWQQGERGGDSDIRRRRIRAEILEAQRIIEQHAPEGAVRLLAHPYGEYDPVVESVVRELDFRALGQHSGVIGPDAPMTRLPRFPVATGYDDMERFKRRVRARRLPATVLAPNSPVLGQGVDRPRLHLRLRDDGYARQRLACYASGQGRIELDWRGEREVVARARQPLGAGRSKYNCTAPETDGSGDYYWLSQLWIRPPPSASGD